MSIRVRRPATTRLALSQGDFLIVKNDLTAGEYRDLMRASTKPITVDLLSASSRLLASGGGAAPATLELDPMAAGVGLVLAYLVDWSFTDADGRPLAIADQPANVVRAALDTIDSESYMEVQQAIQAHQAAQQLARAEEKKTPSPTTGIDAHSPSVV